MATSLTAGHPATGPADRLRETGDRIAALLEASGPPGSTARERAEQLVRLVVDLYGAGLTRLLELTDAAGRLDGPVLTALADDDLVASLLLVHDLHPYGITERVERALAGTRDALRAHAADVELVGVAGDGVALLRVTGGGNGCGSSPATLARAVEEAVLAAAPDLAGVEVESVGGDSGAEAALIPLDALTARLRAGSGTAPGARTGAGTAGDHR
jgi:Fe-S cluster biogenesis protein NfuA